MALKPLKDTTAVPLDEPVLVDLGIETDDAGDRDPEHRAAPEREPADDGAEALKKQLEASQAAQAAADQRARDAEAARVRAERERDDARAQTASTEADAMASGLAAAQAELAGAKTAYKTAFDAGDAEAMANAQEKIGLATADIRDYQRSQAALADRKDEAERLAKSPEAARPTDINEIIDRMEVLPAERAWLKAHPEVISDNRKNRLLDAAFIKATDKGLGRGTDAYFKFIEQDMGYARPDADDEPERTSIVSAPVSRENRGMGGDHRPRTQVRLSPDEREMASLMGMSDAEYALGKVQMQDDKRANPEKYAQR